MRYVWRAAAAAAFLAVCFLVGVASAVAHHAPSGWKYPGECCGTADCFPLNTPADVRRTDAGWLIVETGETIPFDEAQISGDADWHRCFIGQGTMGGAMVRKTRRTKDGRPCLYVPAPEQ